MKLLRIISAVFRAGCAVAAFGATGALALASTAAQPTPINIPNASFENPTTPTGGDGAPIPGWVFNSQSGNLYGTSLISNSFTSEGAALGNNYAFMFNDVAGKTDTITSAASLGIIEPNMSYTLTVAIGNVGGSDSVSNHSPGNVSFSLLANGIAFATDTVPNGTVPDGTFEDFSLTFQTPSSGSIIGESLEIQLASLPMSGPGFGPAFDNVTLDSTSIAVAPEPSTWALLAGGVLIVGWLIRRQKGAARVSVTAVSLALTAALAHATPISIPNASFESPAAPVQSSTNPNILPGWIFTDTGGIAFGTKAIGLNFYSTSYTSGSYYAFIDNNAVSKNETITSAASLGTIEPLTTYTLTVALGNVKAADTTSFGAPGNVSLNLLANGNVFATEEINNGSEPNGYFEDFTLTYTTPETASIIGENLTIQLDSFPQTGSGYQAAFDNVTLDASPEVSDPPDVPEPQIWALLVSGILVLVWRSRWQRAGATT
jgi:hypothetical protein